MNTDNTGKHLYFLHPISHRWSTLGEMFLAITEPTPSVGQNISTAHIKNDRMCRCIANSNQRNSANTICRFGRTNMVKPLAPLNFSEFWEAHNNQYPYSSIKASRQRYRCKHVFLPFHSSFPLTQTCSPTWILKAVTKKEIIPVPPNVEHPYEFLSTRGKSISEEWHKCCLVYLASIVNQPNESTFNPTLKGVVFQCTLILAQKTLRRLPLTLSRRITILHCWVKQCLHWCKTKPINMNTLVPLSLTFLESMACPSSDSKCEVQPMN